VIIGSYWPREKTVADFNIYWFQTVSRNGCVMFSLIVLLLLNLKNLRFIIVRFCKFEELNFLFLRYPEFARGYLSKYYSGFVFYSVIEVAWQGWRDKLILF
jgi:hypothetical protein